MFSLLSTLIHIINSIFSGIYVNSFLKSKCVIYKRKNNKITIILWSIIYFLLQLVIFDVVKYKYPFNDVIGVCINIIIIIFWQSIFFSKGVSGKLFVCISFIAGKEIVKYIVSVLSVALGNVVGSLIEVLLMQGKIIKQSQVEALCNMMIIVTSFMSAILYGLILGVYLLLINKKYVRKEYQLQPSENIFLLLPSIAAICISITIKMMVVKVEDGMETLIYDTVPATLFWIPFICLLLLGAVISNVVLFQNVVQYHEENRKRTLLENQIHQMQKEVQEIQDIYADMRGLRHDMRGHINSIIQYVRKNGNTEDEELDGYIRNMEETVNKLDFGYQSGNPITDIIIHQKKQDAEKQGINFIIDFKYPKDFDIDVYDIGVILNNALENAIEATKLLDRNKYISLSSYVKGNLFFIEVENSFIRNINMNIDSGLPETIKIDKKLHGMGLSNIQRCSRKYNGDIDIVISTAKDNYQVFNLTVMINGKNIRNK